MTSPKSFEWTENGKTYKLASVHWLSEGHGSRWLRADATEADLVRALPAEVLRRLSEPIINTPHTESFLEGVRREAVHQRERWGSEHDAGKGPTDWFWLLGYLAGKAVWAATHGDREKALHHTVSSAAALLNWHAAMSGVSNEMRPGIEEPK